MRGHLAGQRRASELRVTPTSARAHSATSSAPPDTDGYQRWADKIRHIGYRAHANHLSGRSLTVEEVTGAVTGIFRVAECSTTTDAPRIPASTTGWTTRCRSPQQ